MRINIELLRNNIDNYKIVNNISRKQFSMRCNVSNALIISISNPKYSGSQLSVIQLILKS